MKATHKEIRNIVTFDVYDDIRKVIDKDSFILSCDILFLQIFRNVNPPIQSFILKDMENM